MSSLKKTSHHYLRLHLWCDITQKLVLTRQINILLTSSWWRIKISPDWWSVSSANINVNKIVDWLQYYSATSSIIVWGIRNHLFDNPTMNVSMQKCLLKFALFHLHLVNCWAPRIFDGLLKLSLKKIANFSPFSWLNVLAQ